MELTTPTGAAVVAALAESFGAMPPMRISSIGYGAGDRDFQEQANVVRVMVGEPSGAAESTTVSRDRSEYRRCLAAGDRLCHGPAARRRARWMPS